MTRSRTKAQSLIASKKLSETVLKARVLMELRRRKVISSSTTIATEFNVGRSSLRADLALFTDKFIGIERAS
jgi:hypothetical protein